MKPKLTDKQKATILYIRVSFITILIITLLLVWSSTQIEFDGRWGILGSFVAFVVLLLAAVEGHSIIDDILNPPMVYPTDKECEDRDIASLRRLSNNLHEIKSIYLRRVGFLCEYEPMFDPKITEYRNNAITDGDEALHNCHRRTSPGEREAANEGYQMFKSDIDMVTDLYNRDTQELLYK